MIDLYQQLGAITRAFEKAGVEYALCGGLAMAIYGFPRATIDIDFLLPDEGLPAARSAAALLGYTLPASPMNFAKGKIRIERVSKVDPESHDVLTLDLLLVTPATVKIWSDRRRAKWEMGEIWVVSRSGLIELKKLRLSGQDQDDIRRLEGEG